MAGSLDDDIELLNNTQVNENPESDPEGLDHLDSGVNPLAFLSRGCSVDESIHQGSIHALKTAFVALQKKNDVQSKKYANLLQRNKALERLIIAKPQVTERLHGDIHNMDEPSEVHAAGGTSEDETALAVSRANQGYVQHLERELMIANNKKKKLIEEIDILHGRLMDTERKLVNALKENEEILHNYDVKKDAEVQMLNEKLRTEKTTYEHLKLEFENLKQRLENSDRSNINRDAEINTYQSNLATAKSELMKTTVQYRELQKQVENLDKENSALKATCKQYEIEVEISRKQRRDQMDDVDDVDGDVAALNKALMFLSSQREEVCHLKAQIAQQNKFLHLRSKSLSGMHSSSVRQDPSGAVSPPRCEEAYHRHQNQVNPISRLSPLSRNESTRRDFSAGKRVVDSIQPTGNQNIKPMFAMESSSHLKRNEHHIQGNNFIPNINLEPHNGAIKRTDMISNQTVIAQPNRRSSNSPRSGNNQSSYGTPLVEYSNFSPRANRSSSPGSCNDVLPANDFLTNSASTQQRLPNLEHNYMNMPNDDINVPPHMQPNIPLRMTQSEVILRDPTLKGETNNTMSRSVLEPLAETSARNHYILGEIEQEESRFGHLNATQNPFGNQFQEQSNGPDYENIVPKPQNDRKHAVEHGSYDNAYVVANSSASNQRVSPNRDENADVVSVLNICPSCGREFSRMTQEEFQVHVLNCFDSPEDQPATLLATGNEDDRTCPMCGAGFPLTIAQETYEQHVLSHFSDDAGMDRFEMVQ